ncbi:MAG: glutathione S-transferase N-terminal domain-containing protein [Polyangiaceae bacterium]
MNEPREGDRARPLARDALTICMSKTPSMRPVERKLKLIGRSSSHFTRVARIFAAELGVAYSFQAVPDLLSTNAADYAGNPALRLPILESPSGSWFGTLNICRELARHSTRTIRLIWPEDSQEPLLNNAQEFAVQAMTTEVELVMASLARESSSGAIHTKQQASLLNLLVWLNGHVDAALAALPVTRELSYFEVTLFCLLTHLEFRGVVPVAPYPALLAFSAQFGARDSARETAFRFDV